VNPTIQQDVDRSRLSLSHAQFSKRVTITLPTSSTTSSLHIYNIGGDLVKAFEGVSESITWDTIGQSKGVYYIKAMVGGEQVVRKFVLE